MTGASISPFTWRQRYLDRVNRDLANTKRRKLRAERKVTAAEPVTSQVAQHPVRISASVIDAICDVLETVPSTSLPPTVRQMQMCLYEHVTAEPSKGSQSRLARQLTAIVTQSRTVRQITPHERLPSRRSGPDLSL